MSFALWKVAVHISILKALRRLSETQCNEGIELRVSHTYLTTELFFYPQSSFWKWF
jgi:hypothetical protein